MSRSTSDYSVSLELVRYKLYYSLTDLLIIY